MCSATPGFRNRGDLLSGKVVDIYSLFDYDRQRFRMWLSIGGVEIDLDEDAFFDFLCTTYERLPVFASARG
jgi:hypothetical protein